MRFKGLDLNLLVALDALMTERNLTAAARRINLRYASGQHPGQARRSAVALRRQPLWTVGSPSNSTGAGRRLC